MKNLLRNRTVLREVVLNVGSITEVIALYVAYSLGQGNFTKGFLLLLACILINNALSRGWIKLLRE